jgi:hypothetical protein
MSGFYAFFDGITYKELIDLIKHQEATILKKNGSISQAPENELENLKIIRMIVLSFKLLKFFNEYQARMQMNELTLDPKEEAISEKKFQKIRYELSEFMKDCFENDTQK